MSTSGETLKSPSTTTAAELWWGEQWQDDKSITVAEGVISLPGNASGGKLWGVDGNLLAFMSPCVEIWRSPPLKEEAKLST